jgi:hypothetical protein
MALSIFDGYYLMKSFSLCSEIVFPKIECSYLRTAYIWIIFHMIYMYLATMKKHKSRSQPSESHPHEFRPIFSPCFLSLSKRKKEINQSIFLYLEEKYRSECQCLLLYIVFDLFSVDCKLWIFELQINHPSRLLRRKDSNISMIQCAA